MSNGKRPTSGSPQRKSWVIAGTARNGMRIVDHTGRARSAPSGALVAGSVIPTSSLTNVPAPTWATRNPSPIKRS